MLRAQADEDIGRTVAEINAELQAIDELNGEIERLAHLGQVGPELLDRRDALIRSLAEKIDIRTFVQEDNRIAIYTAGGETLLDALPRVVAYNPAATVTHGTAFGRIAIFREDQIDPATGQPIDPTAGIQLVSSGVRASLTPELQNDATPDASQLIASRLRGGRLQGLLEARDLLLPELDDQIQELADNLRFVLNAAHNDGSPLAAACAADRDAHRSLGLRGRDAQRARDHRRDRPHRRQHARGVPDRRGCRRPTRRRSPPRSTRASAGWAAPRSARTAISRSRCPIRIRGWRSPRGTAGSRSPMRPAVTATTASPTTSA